MFTTSRVIFYVCDSCLSRTIRATIKRVVCLYAVPDDLAATVVANGREFMNQEIPVTVTKVLQTAAGRMIFGRPEERYMTER